MPAPTISSAVSQDWGRKLERHRNSLGLSQAGLAARVGVDQATISRLERGKGDFATLLDVAAAAGLILVDLGSS